MTTDHSHSTLLAIGDWTVDPISGRLSRGGASIRLEERPLRLLLRLAEQPGEVLSMDELLSHAWHGVIVSPDSLYQAITSLRRQLGDDPKNPRYIVTVPRRGYRLIAPVARACIGQPAGELGAQESAASTSLADASATAQVDAASPDQTGAASTAHAGAMAPTQADAVQGAQADAAPPTQADAAQRTHAGAASPLPSALRARRRFAAPLALLASVLAVGLIGRYATSDVAATVAAPAAMARSIAVLPFLDLTDQMSEEPFADGMTEELIGKLGKVKGLAVSPPASTFYFKERKVTVAQVSRALHVAYVLDGSVRKAGARLRVAARLTRADDGFVVWTETYDRSWKDKLMIQDDIAGEVATALTKAIR